MFFYLDKGMLKFFESYKLFNVLAILNIKWTYLKSLLLVARRGGVEGGGQLIWNFYAIDPCFCCFSNVFKTWQILLTPFSASEISLSLSCIALEIIWAKFSKRLQQNESKMQELMRFCMIFISSYC